MIDPKKIQDEILAKVRPIFMKQGVKITKGKIDGPYETPNGEETLHDICFEIKTDEMGISIFQHPSKPKYKNQLISLVTGKNKRTIIASLLGMYAEPYVETGAYVAEVFIAPMNANKLELVVVVASGSDKAKK